MLHAEHRATTILESKNIRYAQPYSINVDASIYVTITVTMRSQSYLILKMEYAGIMCDQITQEYIN